MSVVIKGTQVYDSTKGKFGDISILDVLQVFGRAGRPGMETSGEGYICTTEDRLTHYLDKVTSQVCTLVFSTMPFSDVVGKNPIESKSVAIFLTPSRNGLKHHIQVRAWDKRCSERRNFPRNRLKYQRRCSMAGVHLSVCASEEEPDGIRYDVPRPNSFC